MISKSDTAVKVLKPEEDVLTTILNALRALPLPNPSPAREEGLKKLAMIE
jgi:hypothetical protein